MSEYNFAYLDEQTKRMIRRAILKGLAIPGYQVPFASREMPMPQDIQAPGAKGPATSGPGVTRRCGSLMRTRSASAAKPPWSLATQKKAPKVKTKKTLP